MRGDQVMPQAFAKRVDELPFRRWERVRQAVETMAAERRDVWVDPVAYAQFRP